VRVRFDLNWRSEQHRRAILDRRQHVIYSDANGDATTAYIPGSKASPTNGVTIRACYDVNDFAAATCPNRRRRRSPWSPIRCR
jgi:hypothetical protein